MLLGILSDTHGDLHGARQAVRIFDSLGIDVVLHCGDLGSPDVLPVLTPWPVHFVLGNVDRHMALAENSLDGRYVCHDRFGSLTLEGKAIAFLHGDDTGRLRRTIRSRQWDLVCHGHTHSPTKRQEGNTLVVNPGAITRSHQRSVAMVELPSLEVTHIPLS
jgi:putative phosphoesterase